MKTTTFLATLLVASMGFAQVPNYVPTTGLVGWWPFNGNANDESGNNNNGSVNGALLTTDRFGIANKAYSFDGNGDFIDCGNNSSLDLTSSITISVWILANNFNSDHGIVSKCNTTPISYDLITGSNFSVAPLNHVRWLNTGGFLFTNSINSMEWIHVVAIFDGPSVMKKIYLNGVLSVNSVSTANSIPSVSDHMFIGAHQPANVSSWSWDGLLDDIGIWNRALTEQEITNLYIGCTNTSITSQPANTSANPNTTAQFSIAASNATSYQWQSDLGFGFQNISNAGQYSGTTNATLTISNVTATNNNQQFRCIINANGCADTSTVAVLSVSTNGINEIISQKNFAIFPNPANSNFEIKTDLAYDKIEILDIQGRLVQIERKNNVISISSLQKGTYFIRLLDEKSNVIGIQQLVKE